MKRHPEGHAPNAPSPPGPGSVPAAQLLTALLRASGAQTSIPECAVCPKGRSLQKEAERKSPRQLDLHSHEVSFLPQSKKKKAFGEVQWETESAGDTKKSFKVSTKRQDFPPFSGLSWSWRSCDPSTDPQSCDGRGCWLTFLLVRRGPRPEQQR